MAWVETRITRTTQPQDACGIDWSNPLARGLASAPLAKSATFTDNVNSKYTLTSGQYSLVPNSDGHSLAGQVMRLQGPTLNPGLDFTILLVGKTPESTSSTTVAASAGNLWIGCGSNFLRVSNSGADLNAGPATPGKRFVLVGTRSGSNLSAWSDGIKGQTASVSNNAGGPLNLMDYSAGGYSWLGGLNLALVYNRALSDAEIKSLSDNPWAIFEPEVTRFWVDDTVSAGGAATVIPIGVQATGSVGTPSATGAARATPAGVSASSAVGTPIAVGGASIAATALPAGVQATAAIGTVSARGAALAQPAGVTASGAVGAPVAIAGTSITATVLPAGVQASSAVGTPTVTAAAIAQPLGVAATAYVGTPTIATGVSGVAVAYPAGVAAIGQVGTLIATGAAWTAAVGMQAVASVGTPFAYEGALISTTAGAQTRPSRLQSSSRASRIQTGTRASR